MPARIISEARSVVIGKNDLALALSDIEVPAKERAGIKGLTIGEIAGILADTARGANLVQALGMSGKYYVKNYNGVDYVIIRGYAALRPYLPGTRYLATNPTVVRLGLGPIGANSVLKQNIILGLTMYGANAVAQYIAGDGPTLSDLTAGLIDAGASLILSTLASTAASMAVGVVCTAAFPAFLAGAVAGAVVTILYDNWTAEHNVTLNFVRTMEAEARRYLDGLARPAESEDLECLPGLDANHCDPVVRRGNGGGTGEGAGQGTPNTGNGGDDPGDGGRNDDGGRDRDGPDNGDDRDQDGEPGGDGQDGTGGTGGDGNDRGGGADQNPGGDGDTTFDPDDTMFVTPLDNEGNQIGPTEGSPLDGENRITPGPKDGSSQ